jgi:hypothetical protein
LEFSAHFAESLFRVAFRVHGEGTHVLDFVVINLKPKADVFVCRLAAAARETPIVKARLEID